MLKQIVKKVGKVALLIGGGYLCHTIGRCWEVIDITKAQKNPDIDLNHEYLSTPVMFGAARWRALDGKFVIESTVKDD